MGGAGGQPGANKARGPALVLWGPPALALGVPVWLALSSGVLASVILSEARQAVAQWELSLRAQPPCCEEIPLPHGETWDKEMPPREGVRGRNQVLQPGSQWRHVERKVPQSLTEL